MTLQFLAEIYGGFLVAAIIIASLLPKQESDWAFSVLLSGPSLTLFAMFIIASLLVLAIHGDVPP